MFNKKFLDAYFFTMKNLKNNFENFNLLVCCSKEIKANISKKVENDKELNELEKISKEI